MPGQPHQPNPGHVADVLDALPSLASGEWTLTDARALLGDDVMLDGLLGVSHVLLAYLVASGRDEATIWPAARALVQTAIDRQASQ